MRSNSFEMQEVRVIGQKEAGESRGFPIFCTETAKEDSRMEGKEYKKQETLKKQRSVAE